MRTRYHAFLRDLATRSRTRTPLPHSAVLRPAHFLLTQALTDATTVRFEFQPAAPAAGPGGAPPPAAVPSTPTTITQAGVDKLGESAYAIASRLWQQHNVPQPLRWGHHKRVGAQLIEWHIPSGPVTCNMVPACAAVCAAPLLLPSVHMNRSILTSVATYPHVQPLATLLPHAHAPI